MSRGRKSKAGGIKSKAAQLHTPLKLGEKKPGVSPLFQFHGISDLIQSQRSMGESSDWKFEQMNKTPKRDEEEEEEKEKEKETEKETEKKEKMLGQ